MFSSLLAYQITDLAIALATFLLFLRLFPESLRRAAAHAVPRIWGTPFRRLWLLEAPLYAVAVVICTPLLAPVLPLISAAAESTGVNFGFTYFLLVGVLFYAGLLITPAVAIVRAVRWVDRAPAEMRDCARHDVSWSMIAASFTLSLMTYMTVLEPNRVVIETSHVELTEWPEGADQLRVVVLADVQSSLLTDRERRIPQIVEQLRPDVVLIPGDLVAQSLDDRYPTEVGRYIVDNVKARYGVFAVNGDVDQFVAGGLAGVLEGTQARLLSNESVVLPTTPPIELGGFDPQERQEFDTHRGEAEQTTVRIGMVHRPRYSYELADAGYDLVVAGHTHGGQIVLPGIGPPITLSPMPRQMAAGGLHALSAETQLYVSRGIGTEVGFAPPMRFNCPPEVSLLILGPERDVTRPQPATEPTPPLHASMVSGR